MDFITLKTATTTQSSPWTMIIMLVIFVAIFYFMLIRPQKKREKEEQKMRNDIQVGDEIISIGGICVRIVSIKEDSIIVESPADHSKIKLLRTAIQTNKTEHDNAQEKPAKK